MRIEKYVASLQASDTPQESHGSGKGCSGMR